MNILEAKKDGVLLREIEETLAVDAFTVLRPRLSEAQIKRALPKGLSHAGKLYDFVFDFATSDRLVCMEVIYRSYHGVGDIEFILSSMAGRNCLSAEGFLNQAISGMIFTKEVKPRRFWHVALRPLSRFKLYSNPCTILQSF